MRFWLFLSVFLILGSEFASAGPRRKSRRRLKRVRHGTSNGRKVTVREPEWAVLPANGKDDNKLCCLWAAEGWCDQRPFWMRPHCQRSCGTAGCQIANALECKVKLRIAGCPFLPLSVPLDNTAIRSVKAQSGYGGMPGATPPAPQPGPVCEPPKYEEAPSDDCEIMEFENDEGCIEVEFDCPDEETVEETIEETTFMPTTEEEVETEETLETPVPPPGVDESYVTGPLNRLVPGPANPGYQPSPQPGPQPGPQPIPAPQPGPQQQGYGYAGVQQPNPSLPAPTFQPGPIQPGPNPQPQSYGYNQQRPNPTGPFPQPGPQPNPFPNPGPQQGYGQSAQSGAMNSQNQFMGQGMPPQQRNGAQPMPTSNQGMQPFPVQPNILIGMGGQQGTGTGQVFQNIGVSNQNPPGYPSNNQPGPQFPFQPNQAGGNNQGQPNPPRPTMPQPPFDPYGVPPPNPTNPPPQEYQNPSSFARKRKHEKVEFLKRRASKCKNNHVLCNFWAEDGECQKNPKMLKTCRKACSLC